MKCKAKRPGEKHGVGREMCTRIRGKEHSLEKPDDNVVLTPMDLNEKLSYYDASA